ncbi:hypothetical protein [Nostoc sp.]
MFKFSKDNAAALSQSDEIEKLVVGEQEENYPAKMCVDLLHCLL